MMTVCVSVAQVKLMRDILFDTIMYRLKKHVSNFMSTICVERNLL